MKKIIHPLAGGVAILMIAIFWLSTAISELSGSEPFVVLVKTLIPWGFIILAPALAAVGGTGFALGGGRSSGLVGKKRKRMPIIAANGVLILIPSALFLAAKAKAGDFDGTFYTIQMVELAAGAVNLWLLTKNALDGRKLTARRRSSARR
ncbi:MAG: hypothetical protein CL510_07180 [Actinobacteria bacterium]|nr:hypothetical protein [Actinomycetota bacterium]|tara:strand:+ start:200 stop:649 length:450 start_codon:yes stop_codon:yes gene_type:complete